MRSARWITPVLGLLFASACGGSDGPTDPGAAPSPPPGASANFTARVDGQAWASAANLTNVTAIQSGTYSISGSVLSGSTSRNITLNLMNIPGPGTSTRSAPAQAYRADPPSTRTTSADGARP